MKRDGAENAKAEVFLQAFRYSEVASPAAGNEIGATFLPLPGTGAYADIVRARRSASLEAREKIAIGILTGDPDDHSRDVKLGVFVQHKKLRDHPVVEAAQRIAKGEAQVIVTGRVRRHAALNPGRSRPLLMGGSVGHHRVTAGTIGCFAVGRTGGKVGILSNNHVLANTNQGKQGDIILQPGRRDWRNQSGLTNRVATLESYVPIDFAPNAINLVDCAFALLDDDMTCDAANVGHPIAKPFAWRLGGPDELIFDNVPVRKFGRTTGYTEGMAIAIGVNNVAVQMFIGGRPHIAMFNQQVAIDGSAAPFSKPGDSGSLICTENGSPVALLFAGAETGGRNGRGITYANPIHAVLDALDIDIHSVSEGDDHG